MRRNKYSRSKGKLSSVALLVIGFFLVGGTIVATLFISERVTKQESTTIHIDEVRELATLATAEAKVTLVKEEVDHLLFNKNLQVDFLPGTKREILLIVPATVIAGVDLKNLTEDDLKVNEETKTIELVLPSATFLQEPTIDMDDIKTYSYKGLLAGELKWDEGFDITAIAQDEIKEEAKTIGLLQTAENNAEKALKEFLGHLGYTVEISFK